MGGEGEEEGEGEGSCESEGSCVNLVEKEVELKVK
jgi:hypothetical protein